MTDVEEMTLAELRTADPKEFARRCNLWREAACDYGWWDCVYECFAEDLKAEGFELDQKDTCFSLGYCQSDYAEIAGRLTLATWLRSAGYETTHLALVLDAEDFGASVRVHGSRRSFGSVDINYEPGNCHPSGVFKDLPQADWDELVRIQWESEDWEGRICEWVRTKNNAMYRKLRDEYEYLTSEEMFVEQGDAA